MALNIKDGATERLVTEVAELTGETETQAVRVALEERHERLMLRAAPLDRRAHLRRVLEDELWPQLPADALAAPLTREQRETALGYGPEGV